MSETIIPIFDLGGVLSRPDDLLDASAAVVGLRGEDIRASYGHGRHAYDAGGSALEYWPGVFAEHDVTIDAETSRRLSEADCEAWAGIRPTALSILTDLLDAGHEVFLLSNAPALMDGVLRRTHWAPRLTGVLISGVLGEVKPDLPIYRAMERMISRDNVTYAFIDDRQENVDGALAAGWQAHLWTSDEDTRAWVTELGLLGAR